ncbi:hypothetical protein BJ912DRAFT_1047724 [Pholiota molesta]|nr:hypothetical protein BJ912DRAFT_1047724 [Pholiota molesta]
MSSSAQRGFFDTTCKPGSSWVKWCPVTSLYGCFCSVLSCSSAGRCTSPIALVQICIATWSFRIQKNFSIRLSSIIAPMNTNSKAPNCMRMSTPFSIPFYDTLDSSPIPNHASQSNRSATPIMTLAPGYHMSMEFDWESSSIRMHPTSALESPGRLDGWRNRQGRKCKDHAHPSPALGSIDGHGLIHGNADEHLNDWAMINDDYYETAGDYGNMSQQAVSPPTTSASPLDGASDIDRSLALVF